MSRYKLLLEIDTTIRDGRITDIIIPIDSLEKNLVEVINENVQEHNTISFDRYYENAPIMLWGNCFPYIEKNGNFKWYVPYSEVTISDFLETHKLSINDKIRVHIDYYGGSGDGLSIIIILPWLLMLMSEFNNIVDFFTNVKELFKKIASIFKSKKELVSLQDVKGAIRKTNEWSSGDLEKALGTSDEVIIHSLMEWCGFHKQGNNYLIGKDTIDFGTLQSKYWGKGKDIYSYSYLERLCIELNQNLAVLRWISDDDTSALFKFAEYTVDLLISNNEEHFKRGSGLNYIETTPKYCDSYSFSTSNTCMEDDDQFTNKLETGQIFDLLTMTEEMIQFVVKVKYGLELSNFASG